MPTVLTAGLIPGPGRELAHPREYGMPGRELLARQAHRVMPSAQIRVPDQPEPDSGPVHRLPEPPVHPVTVAGQACLARNTRSRDDEPDG